ncbi:hypothetical protein [Saccharopolyspora ipomoeae]|uniref:hypothetical protein n=1 Tax=Saccharopolyspora ipomoeae TaxID=3042027 RepID=UPI003CCF7F98
MEANTRQGYEYTLRKYLLPEFAPMRMNEIAPNHIRSFFTRLGTDGASATTGQAQDWKRLAPFSIFTRFRHRRWPLPGDGRTRCPPGRRLIRSRG